MKLLILGGTRFVGRHMAEAALAAGHEVTLFNRNRQGTDLGVETLVGDRLHDVSALKGRTWDAVIDVSAYTPAAARRSAEALQGAVPHYTFISTVSVYEGFAQPGLDEQAPVATLPDDEAEAAALSEPVSADLYGPLKARCEGVVREVSRRVRSSSGPASSSARTTTPTASPTGCGASVRAGPFWLREAPNSGCSSSTLETSPAGRCGRRGAA